MSANSSELEDNHTGKLNAGAAKKRPALSDISNHITVSARNSISHSSKLSAARLFGSFISVKDLISVSWVIPNEVVQAIFSACRSGNFDLANKEVKNVIVEGYRYLSVAVSGCLRLSQLYDIVVDADNISDEQKARLC